MLRRAITPTSTIISVWSAISPTGRLTRKDAHPTVKPVTLLAEAIRDVTRQGEIVIDAFAGSGSTILACERAKRICYAVEIEPRYIDVAIRRWEALTGKTATLERLARPSPTLVSAAASIPNNRPTLARGAEGASRAPHHP